MDKIKFKKAVIAAVSLAIASALIFAGCSAPASASATPAVTAAPAPPSSVMIDLEGNKILVDKLTVSATGSVKVMPDVAYVNLAVSTQNKKMKTAQSDNKNLMNAVYAALKNAGLTDEDIRTTGYNISPLYDYSTNKAVLYAYQVYNSIEITVKDLDKIGDYIDAAAAAGANTDYSITFDLLDKNGATNQALAQAMSIARSKADALAKAGGYTIAGTLEVTEGYSNYSPQYRYEVPAKAEDAASTPINAGQMEITATVTAVYQIK